MGEEAQAGGTGHSTTQYNSAPTLSCSTLLQSSTPELHRKKLRFFHLTFLQTIFFAKNVHKSSISSNFTHLFEF